MWTDETRLRHDRSGLRYTHDLMDEEWAEVAPLIPPAKPGGNKRTVNVREVVNGIMYLLVRAANGVIFRKTFRLKVQCTTTWIDGITTERWS